MEAKPAQFHLIQCSAIQIGRRNLFSGISPVQSQTSGAPPGAVIGVMWCYGGNKEGVENDQVFRSYVEGESEIVLELEVNRF